MVKLRLKRYGKKREASYRIVAIDSRARRQGRPIQELGYYNPRTKETILQAAEIAKWLKKGAQPSDTLRALLNKARIFDMVNSGEEISSDPVTIEAAPKKEAPAPKKEEPAAEAAAEEATTDEAATEEVAEETTEEATPEASAEDESASDDAAEETAEAEAEVEEAAASA
ncbi:MAG: 30S ribosomal protein S16 [Cyanobacteria bacterium P01_A01_bin.3]